MSSYKYKSRQAKLEKKNGYISYDNLPEKLCEFLQHQGIVNSYLKAVEKANFSGIRDVWNDYADTPDIIELSFVWALTSEGTDYWSAMDILYRNWYYQITN